MKLLLKFNFKFLIVPVVFVGDRLSIYGFQKLYIEAVIIMFINCYFWAFCNALIRQNYTNNFLCET